MAYRITRRQRERLAAMRAAKERKRLMGEPVERAPELPELRRTIIVIDHDFGTVEHRIDLYRTNRVDCYRAVADGKEWKPRIGWSGVLEGLRKSLPRVLSPRHVA